MIGFYVSAEEGYISLSAIFYLMFLGFYTFPIPGIRRTLGVTFWNWDFDSGFQMVEHWHLGLKFRPASILDPRESFFSQLKVDIGFLGVDIGIWESLLGL